MLSSSGRKSRAVNESIIDFHDNERNGKKEKRRKEGKKSVLPKPLLNVLQKTFDQLKSIVIKTIEIQSIIRFLSCYMIMGNK